MTLTDGNKLKNKVVISLKLSVQGLITSHLTFVSSMRALVSCVSVHWQWQTPKKMSLGAFLCLHKDVFCEFTAILQATHLFSGNHL